MPMFFVQFRTYFCIALTFIFALTGHIPGERATKPACAEEEIRIMSFNIRYGEYEQRFSVVPELIGEYMPDSAGLQECTFIWAMTLKVFLPEYGFVGVGRDTGDLSIESGESSPVLYRKDKYKLKDSGTFWLSETPNEVSYGWDADCRRVCTWAVLQNKETKDEYVHINTHFDHVGYIAREKSAEIVLDFAKKFDMPAVITGDLNFYKGTEGYSLFENAGFSDTSNIAENTDSGKTFHNYSGGTEGTQIDYIFVNDYAKNISTYKIIRDTYDGQYPSDHYPIYADIEFEKSETPPEDDPFSDFFDNLFGDLC